MRVKRNGRIIVSLLALVAAVTSIAVVHATRPEASGPPQAASVLFVGDSFTAGAGAPPGQAYPELIANRSNWDLHVDAEGATGFIHDGQGTGNGQTSRLIDRLAEDGRKFPTVDVVIVDAGRNDLDRPADQISLAMSDYLTAVTRQWPTAKIVAILPSYVRPGGYDAYSLLRQALTHDMTAVDGTLVDPVAEGWYTNVDVTAMVIDDKVHPNELGNAYIADRLATSLRSKDIIPSD